MLKRLLIEHLSAEFVLSLNFSKGRVTVDTRFIVQRREKALTKTKGQIFFSIICIIIDTVSSYVLQISLRVILSEYATNSRELLSNK